MSKFARDLITKLLTKDTAKRLTAVEVPYLSLSLSLSLTHTHTHTQTERSTPHLQSVQIFPPTSQVLEHPWLASGTASKIPIDPKVVQAMANFDAGCKFKWLTLKFVASRMSAWVCEPIHTDCSISNSPFKIVFQRRSMRSRSSLATWIPMAMGRREKQEQMQTESTSLLSHCFLLLLCARFIHISELQQKLADVKISTPRRTHTRVCF